MTDKESLFGTILIGNLLQEIYTMSLHGPKKEDVQTMKSKKRKWEWHGTKLWSKESVITEVELERAKTAAVQIPTTSFASAVPSLPMSSVMPNQFIPSWFNEPLPRLIRLFEEKGVAPSYLGLPPREQQLGGAAPGPTILAPLLNIPIAPEEIKSAPEPAAQTSHMTCNQKIHDEISRLLVEAQKRITVLEQTVTLKDSRIALLNNELKDKEAQLKILQVQLGQSEEAKTPKVIGRHNRT